jgi:hypothetical protein
MRYAARMNRTLLLLPLLVASPAFADMAEKTAPAALKVHEWGVWQLKHGQRQSLADLARENPPFVLAGQGAVRPSFPRVEAPPVVAKKPVMFFYAPQPVHVDVRVDFPGGRPAFFFPRAEETASGLHWSVEVGQKGALQTPPKGHWWQHLRGVGASAVTAGGQAEQFLFYDGETAFAPRVGFTVTGAEVALRRQEPGVAKKSPMPAKALPAPVPEEVLVTDGVHTALAARFGAEAKLAWPPPPDAPGRSAKDELTRMLRGAGLSEAETKALLDTWKPALLDKGGRRAIWLLPRADYDDMLPLTLTPEPTELVRVGLVIEDLD